MILFVLPEITASDEATICMGGSYDYNGPNGATHWVMVSGKDMEDHLMLYDELQKQDDFYKLLSERGEVERVGDVELEMLTQLEGIVEN